MLQMLENNSVAWKNVDIFFLSQVNDISLIGETHKEVVRILKELPLCVYMTCCRPTPHLQTHIETVQPQAEGLSAMPKLKVLCLIHSATVFTPI